MRRTSPVPLPRPPTRRSPPPDRTTSDHHRTTDPFYVRPPTAVSGDTNSSINRSPSDFTRAHLRSAPWIPNNYSNTSNNMHGAVSLGPPCRNTGHDDRTSTPGRPASRHAGWSHNWQNGDPTNGSGGGMVAVKQRPTQAVSRLPPNPLHEHQTSPNQCPRQGVWTSDRGRNLARVVPSTSQATVLPEDLASIVSATHPACRSPSSPPDLQRRKAGRWRDATIGRSPAYASNGA